MALKDNLLSTASKLIGQFGSDVELKKVVTGNKVYDPITDEYVGDDESIVVNTKCSYTMLANGDNTVDEFPEVRRVCWVYYQDEISDIDNKWTANDNKIYKTVPLEVQNQQIVYKLYIG